MQHTTLNSFCVLDYGGWTIEWYSKSECSQGPYMLGIKPGSMGCQASTITPIIVFLILSINFVI